MNLMKMLIIAVTLFSMNAYAQRGVELYHDDGRCNEGSFIEIVDFRTNCSMLSGKESVWGIKIAGVCKDISDLDAVSACEKYKTLGGSPRSSVQLYHDDGKCNPKELIGSVSSRTNCSALEGMQDTWGIRIGGVCKDISDMKSVDACKKYRTLGGSARNAVQLFHDDGKCQPSELIANVDVRTDCSSLQGMQAVWGIKIGNSCKDISDMNAVSACERYKTLGGTERNSVQLYHDDGKCEDKELIANVSRRTNCASLQGMDRVWGIKLNGVCQDISDMNAVQACEKYKNATTRR